MKPIPKAEREEEEVWYTKRQPAEDLVLFSARLRQVWEQGVERDEDKLWMIYRAAEDRCHSKDWG